MARGTPAWERQLSLANLDLLSVGRLNRNRTFSNNTWLEFLIYFGHHDGKARPSPAED